MRAFVWTMAAICALEGICSAIKATEGDGINAFEAIGNAAIVIWAAVLLA